MAGYNTVCEILKFGKKAIVIPRSGQGEEQKTRGRIFENLGLLSTIPPEKLEPKVLADKINQTLFDNNEPDGDKVPNLNGASRTAKLLVHQYCTNLTSQKRGLGELHIQI